MIMIIESDHKIACVTTAQMSWPDRIIVLQVKAKCGCKIFEKSSEIIWESSSASERYANENKQSALNGDY